MSKTDPPIWTMLPREITLIVVEHACSSSKLACLSLCLVCSWTKSVAERYLCVSVAIRSSKDLHVFRASKSVVLTKSIWIHGTSDSNGVGEVEAVSDIFDRAIHLQHFSTGLWKMTQIMDHKDFGRVFRCTSLIIGGGLSSVHTALHPHTMFSSGSKTCTIVTHLEFDGGPNAFFVNCNVREIFPCLTHLAWTFECRISETNSLRQAFDGSIDALVTPRKTQLFVIHLLQRLNYQQAWRAALRNICENAMQALHWPPRSWVVIVDKFPAKSPVDGGNIWVRAQEMIEVNGYPGEMRTGMTDG